MSDTVIRVENLGKKYIIGHQQKERYSSLREVLSNGAKSLAHKLLTPVKRISNQNFEEFWALKDVSFEIKQGDRVGIIGRNGAGKSTLLKILSRITEPTCGSVTIKGRVATLLEVGTGFHPELTGRENIYLNGAILGMSKFEIKKKFDEIVDFAEVEKFLDTPVKRYSSGMYVRLAFAVAAHLEPEILIVDEVLAVGDIQFQKKCLGKMKEVGQEGRTVLFVSHNMSAITSLCTKGVVLKQGQVAYLGSMAGATAHYINFVSRPNDSAREWITPTKWYPYSDIIEINRFCIINEHKNVHQDVMLTSQNYEAVIDITLNKPEPNLIFGLAFYANDHSLLFITNVKDTLHIDLGSMLPGKYQLSVPVPINLLANGQYFIEVLCVIHMLGWVLSSENESRIIIDVFRDANPTTEILIPGIQQSISPLIKWSVSGTINN